MAVMPDSFGCHPVVACAERVGQELVEIAAVPVELMSTEDKAAALVAVSVAADQADALRLRLLAAADDVAAESGARDAGAWLAQETRGDGREQQRDLRLGQALAERWRHLGDAFARGAANLAQTRVIAHALDELPSDVPAELVAQAEAQLVTHAADFGPRELRVLGRRILDVVAPEVAEAAEAQALEAEERRARAHTSLQVQRRGDGFMRIITDQPDTVANRLLTYLDAFTSPRQPNAAGSEAPVAAPDSRGPLHVQRGHAFAALLELLDPDRLPAHGGDATTVIVTIGLDQLRKELAAGDLIGHDLDRVTASEARRLACTADLIPAVLGSDSEVLDLGRASRLFSRAQRKALRIRDKGCRAEGCGAPAAWTEAHHKDPWARGGPTDLANGISLCSFHHHRCHDDTYLHEFLPNGDVRYRRRT